MSKFRIRRRRLPVIELLITGSLVALAASIAFPSYEKSIRVAHRHDGQTLLSQVMKAEQDYFAMHQHYTDQLDLLGLTLTTGGRISSSEGYYRAHAAFCTPKNPDCIALIAIPQGKQAADGDLMLDSRGRRSPTEHW
ncbi:MAG: hypothetical protein HY940_07455 [Gammaproteobacteria bacterium]|nr:hypothetical protein [Gammaproteobacteria bacterium]